MQKVFLDIFTNILNSVRQPLLVLDSDLKIVKANHSFYMTFSVKPKETEGTLIYDLGNRQWNIPKLKELLEKILPENTVFNDFRVEHIFDGIGPKIMNLNARRIYKDSKKTDLILLAIEDVTENEYHKRHLEKIVSERTAQLVLEKQKAEQKKQIAEKSLQEIESLKKQLEDERAYLKAEIKLENNHENIIGQSDALKYVLYKVEQIADTNTTVLILGETGTGKELAARAIHGFSSRKSRALIKVNCAALPSNLIESELFGHEKGAFTGADCKHMGRFEIADNATLFLDEIGELPFEYRVVIRLARVSRAFIHQCEQEDLITTRIMVHGKKGLCFSDVCKLKMIRHLHEDMGLNLEAVDFVLRYQRQIQMLNLKLGRMKADIRQKEKAYQAEILSLRRQLESSMRS